MGLTSESWATIQVTSKDLEQMRAFQQIFIDKKGAAATSYNFVYDQFKSAITGVLTGAAAKAVFMLTGAGPGQIATLATLTVSMLSALGQEATENEYKGLTAGRKGIEEVKKFLDSNSQYQLVEVTFRKRIYWNPSNGYQVAMILGNPSNIKAGYEIKRVRLKNGTWIQK